MKSYQKHLESVMAPGGNKPPATRKPVFRSSAIFPVLLGPEIETRISFLGYWLIKRNIPEVAILCTLREKSGRILHRWTESVDVARAFSIEVRDELARIGRSEPSFEGSIELEVFATRDLVFPYPAFVVCYHGEAFSTAVHTVGRIYNDADDWKENDEAQVAESGFDVHGGPGMDPFFAFTNGPFASPAPVLSCQFIRADGDAFEAPIRLPDLEPYETVWLRLKDHIDLEGALGEGPGTVKIKHEFRGFYPRFVAGNFQTSPTAISVTHTYYDCSSAGRPVDYWEVPHDGYHDCAMLVPVYANDGMFTELVVYPVISPSVFMMSVELRANDGALLASFPDLLRVDTAENPLQHIRLDTLCAAAGVPRERVAGAYIVARWVEGSRVPTRLKLGLNIGFEGREVRLPCNICFAPQLGNPAVERKAGTFRWAPILHIGRSEVVLTLASPAQVPTAAAKVELSFFRETDGEVIERHITLPPYGQVRIAPSEDAELREFLQGRTGWISARSDNPWLGGWYFDFHESGSVAADHFF